MNSSVVRWAFAPLLLAFAAFFTGCQPDTTPSTASVRIDGTPRIGEKLTATVTGTGFTGNFVWQSASAANATTWTDITGNVAGTNNSELTLTAALDGQFVRAKRTNSGGDKVSNSLGPISAAATTPTVTVTGNTVAGEKLTAKSTGGAFTGNFVWASANTANAEVAGWTPITSDIAGTDGSELTLTAALEGKYIRATRIIDGGASASDPVGPVTAATVPKVTLAGDPVVGEKITATSADGTFTGNFTWEAGRSVGVNGVASIIWEPLTAGIAGTDNSELTLTGELTGKYIQAKRKAAGTDVASESLGPITAALQRTAPITAAPQQGAGEDAVKTYADSGMESDLK